MNDTPPETPTTTSLEQLLLREDMWLGHSQRFTKRAAVETGYDELNANLISNGWPLSSLIEVCQESFQGEWHLFTPAFLEIPGLIVLINPPADPFSQAFIQSEIDLERLIVVNASEKNHFIACFIEAVRASVGCVMAWQPKEPITYTELRKCLLAAAEGTGLSVMFRPSTAQQQSSPAGLRLYVQMVPTGLEITIFKQKGHLQMQQARPIVIGLPESWKPSLSYNMLNQDAAGIKRVTPPKRLATVTPLRGKP